MSCFQTWGLKAVISSSIFSTNSQQGSKYQMTNLPCFAAAVQFGIDIDNFHCLLHSPLLFDEKLWTRWDPFVFDLTSTMYMGQIRAVARRYTKHVAQIWAGFILLSQNTSDTSDLVYENPNKRIHILNAPEPLLFSMGASTTRLRTRWLICFSLAPSAEQLVYFCLFCSDFQTLGREVIPGNWKQLVPFSWWHPAREAKSAAWGTRTKTHLRANSVHYSLLHFIHSYDECCFFFCTLCSVVPHYRALKINNLCIIM